MAGRPLMLATLLGASIGVPYVVSRSSSGPNAENSPPAAAKPPWPTFGAFSSASTAPTPPPPGPAGTGTQPYAATTPPEPFRFHRIEDVFRFDISKEWVYQNWDRKSTGLADPELFGIRVALVTGMQRTDLAGSLTYYFDSRGQVEHISFRGRTADAAPLVQFLTRTYQFQPMEPPPGERLYQVRSGKSVYSELRTRPESVLVESTPHGSIGVVLELGRPGSNRPLKPQVPPLQIPEVAQSSPPPGETAAATDGDAPAEPALIGKIRPATPTEESQVLWRRWPN